MNLLRDPRWGRGQETPGEDPYLASEYAAEYIYNLQFGQDERYLKAIATVKHFADYDQEGNYGTLRYSFNANVTDQDQVEFYWPAFRSAIQRGKAQSIMCSYNLVNGIPSCGNGYFMNEIARNQWGFDGFIISDCGALNDDGFNKYACQIANCSQAKQAAIAMKNGCDAECGSFWMQAMPEAYKDGQVNEQDIDQSVGRLLSKIIDLGLMDYPGPYYNTYGPEKVDSVQNRKLALNVCLCVLHYVFF